MTHYHWMHGYHACERIDCETEMQITARLDAEREARYAADRERFEKFNSEWRALHGKN
jgi:hypothetical protein